MKKYKKISILIVVAMVSIFAVKALYLTVDGNFLTQYIIENELTEITVEKGNNGNTLKEITLNKIQIEKLKSLFDNTALGRTFSSIIRYSDKDTYTIVGKTAKGRQCLYLEAQGQEFVAVHLSNGVDQRMHCVLTIKNAEWKAMMEDIISN